MTHMLRRRGFIVLEWTVVTCSNYQLIRIMAQAVVGLSL